MGLVRRIRTDHRKDDLSRIQLFLSLSSGDQLAIRREDTGNIYKIVWCQAAVPESHFETREFFSMPPDTFSQKDLLSYKQVENLKSSCRRDGSVGTLGSDSTG